MEPAEARASLFITPQDEVQAARPDIVDRNGEVLATDLATASLYAEPRRIVNVDEATEALTRVLPEVEPRKLREELATERGFVWLKREISAREREKVHDLGIPGVVDEKGLMFKIQWMTRQRKVDLGPVKAERHYRLNRMDAKNIIAALLRPMYVEPHRTRSRRIYLVGKDSEGNPRGLIIVIEDKIVVITAGLHAGLKASPGSRKEAGEVIPFPSESVAPAEKRPDPARMLEPGFSHEKGSWFVVSAMGLPVAWYDRSHQAERAAAFLRRSFAEGADEGTYSPMRFAIEMAQATERVYDEFAGEHDPWDLYRFIEQWFSSPKHAKDRRAVAEQVVGIHEIPKGSVAPGLQPMSGPPEHVSEETFAKARAFGLDKQLEHPRDMADLVAEHLIDAVMSRRAEEGGAR